MLLADRRVDDLWLYCDEPRYRGDRLLNVVGGNVYTVKKLL